MQRHHYRYQRGPFLKRPGLPPFGRSGLLGGLLIGGLGYLIGRQSLASASRAGNASLTYVSLPAVDA